ncbi:hypothetical protein [Micromonospora chokoriensis]|uniref:hypothetical protein n=1 Tax=Micromonospora chokoriensis TaxID=356851 RepID=UPI0012FB30C5|nr:hypothetical protein [Micromonospora chokoriensis]
MAQAVVADEAIGMFRTATTDMRNAVDTATEGRRVECTSKDLVLEVQSVGRSTH